jgi:hypothetical protein
MCYFGRQHYHHGARFRLDTRIYLQHRDVPASTDPCIGAIIAKNPGSAVPAGNGNLTTLTLNGDKMLPSVRNRFLKAYALSGEPIPKAGFVMVWNLFYLCGPKLGGAIKSHSAISALSPPLLCPWESLPLPRIVWFAWGGTHKYLDPLKHRFQRLQPPGAFFFDKRLGKVVTGTPQNDDFAKHPQGMPASPVVAYLKAHL